MKTVIIVSECQTVDVGSATFKFKGAVDNTPINKVHLYHDNKDIKVGEEYLMYCQITDLKDGTLTGTILKLKPVDASWAEGMR